MTTGVWCTSCGTALPSYARFCGSCGEPLGSVATAPAPPVSVPLPAPVPSVEAAPTPASVPLPAPAPSVEAAPPAPASPPTVTVPAWLSTATARRDRAVGSTTASEGSSITAPTVAELAGAAWSGVATAVGAAVAAMAGLGLLAMLLLHPPGATARVILGSAAMTVCAAVGGDAFARVDAASAGSSASASLGAIPLTVTFVGLTVLAVMFLRAARTATARATLVQAVQTTVVFAVVMGVLALLSRMHYGGKGQRLSVETSFGAATASTVVGGVLFCGAALSVALFVARPDVLPARLSSLRSLGLPALLAAVGVFAVSIVVALGGLLVTLATQPERLRQLGVATLALPNVAWGGLLLGIGVPLHGAGTASLLGTHLGARHTGVTFGALTDATALWWLAPLFIAATLVASCVVVVVRQHTLVAARRESWRLAGSFAALALLAALLLRISGDFAGHALGDDVSVGGHVSLTFAPVIALLLAGGWGAAAALVAPYVATRTSGGLVHRLHALFGTADAPEPGAAG